MSGAQYIPNYSFLDLDTAMLPGGSGDSRSSQVAAAIAYWNAFVANAVDQDAITYGNGALALLTAEQARLNDPLHNPDNNNL